MSDASMAGVIATIKAQIGRKSVLNKKKADSDVFPFRCVATNLPISKTYPFRYTREDKKGGLHHETLGSFYSLPVMLRWLSGILSPHAFKIAAESQCRAYNQTHATVPFSPALDEIAANPNVLINDPDMTAWLGLPGETIEQYRTMHPKRKAKRKLDLPEGAKAGKGKTKAKAQKAKAAKLAIEGNQCVVLGMSKNVEKAAKPIGDFAELARKRRALQKAGDLVLKFDNYVLYEYSSNTDKPANPWFPEAHGPVLITTPRKLTFTAAQ